MGNANDFCDCNNRDPRTETNLNISRSNNGPLCPFMKTVYFQSFTIDNTNQAHLATAYKLPHSYTNNIDDNIRENYELNINFHKNKSKHRKINIKNKGKKSQEEKVRDINENFDTNQSKSSTPIKMMETVKKGKIYIEEEKNGVKEGFGLHILNKGVYHVGIYHENKANGIGKSLDGNFLYKGEFENDRANGFGIYSNNEIFYEGYWLNDKQEKYGIEKWVDGTLYIGEFSDGQKNGIGSSLWKDGAKYEGEYINNSFNGYGIYYYNDKQFYLGEWKNNMKNGYGEYVIEDKIFIGYYSMGKRNGLGVYYIKNENKMFLGFWKNGKKSGLGKFFYEQKFKYGIWEDDKKINLFINENEVITYLKDNNLSIYYNIFLLSKNDILNIYKDVYSENNITKCIMSEYFFK